MIDDSPFGLALSQERLSELLERKPRSLPPLRHPACQREETSRLCGARVALQLELDEDRTVRAYSYQTDIGSLGFLACSLLFERLPGASLGSLLGTISAFEAVLYGTDLPPKGALGELSIFSGLKDFPERREQVWLPFHTLKKAISPLA